MALLSAITAVSLIVIPLYGLGFELPKLLAAGVFAMGASLWCVLRGRESVGILWGSASGKFIIFFAVVLLISPLWSAAPIVSIVGSAPRYQGIAFRIALIGIAILCASHHKSCERAVLIANMLVVGYGVMQMLQTDPFAMYWQSEAFLGRIFSTIGHPNSLGQFVILTVPFVVRRAIKTTERSRTLVWSSIALLNLVIVLGTVSRSTLLALALVTLLYVPYIKKWKFTPSRAAITLLIVALCTAVASLFFTERFSRAVVVGRSASARSVMWSGAVQMMTERPYGYGVEALSFLTPRFIGKDLYEYEALTTVVDRVHSEPLELFVTLGPLGLMSYYGIVCAILLLLWKKRSSDSTGMATSCIAAIVAYNVTLLFGFASIATAVLFWVVIGMTLGMFTATKPVKRHYAFIANMTIVVASVASLMIAVQWIQARRYHESAEKLSGQSMLAYHQEGIMTFRYDRQSLIQVAERHIQYYAQHPSEELHQSIETLLAMHASLTNGYDGMNKVLEAWFQAEQGETEKTILLLAEAKRALPENVTYYRTAIHIAEVLGDTALEKEYRAVLQSILPKAFWNEGSEMRRLLLKQHPWLQDLTS